MKLFKSGCNYDTTVYRRNFLIKYEITFTLNYTGHVVDCSLQRTVIVYAVLRIHDEFYYDWPRFRHTDKYSVY